MGERTKYTPGTFCWVDVSTPDAEGAKRFYSALFGWGTTDIPIGDGAVYTMADVGGRTVSAISPQQQAQVDAGVPPMWNSYIAVESADAAAARAKELGADVHAGPFDVMEAGRMAVIQDPQGAFFMVWEAKSTIGAELVNGHGLFTWSELTTGDIGASQSFYGDLLGWTFDTVDVGGMPYVMIKNAAGWNNGGLRAVVPGGPPVSWTVYFGTDDLAASTATAAEQGGTVVMPAMEIPGFGSIAAVSDPQGAVFALFHGEVED